MKTRILVGLFTLLCTQTFLPRLTAQSVVFANRNGLMTAYCGATPGGPGEVKRFSTPDTTHEVMVVADPGSIHMPQSSASSRFDVTASSSGITIVAAGSAQRGALDPLQDFGAAAVAAVNDSWELTLTAPARFTFNALVNTSSSTTRGVDGGFSFTATAPNLFIPDPGTAADAFSARMPDSDTITRQAKGRLLPGRYLIYFNIRADGANTYPFTGSFNMLLALELSPDVPAIVQTRILPTGLVMEWTDLGAKRYTVETTTSLTGNPWVPVSGVEWPISTNLVVLPQPLASPAFYRVNME